MTKLKLLADYGLEWQEVERKIVLPDDWQCTLKRILKTKEKKRCGF